MALGEKTEIVISTIENVAADVKTKMDTLTGTYKDVIITWCGGSKVIAVIVYT